MDDLAKQKTAGIKKINPGRTGKIIPIRPIIEKKIPHQKKNNLVILPEDGSTFINNITDELIKQKKIQEIAKKLNLSLIYLTIK